MAIAALGSAAEVEMRVGLVVEQCRLPLLDFGLPGQAPQPHPGQSDLFLSRLGLFPLTVAAVGKSFRHGGTGSGAMHRALRAMIRSSGSYDEFIAKLNQWADRELVPSHSARWPQDPPLGRYSLPDTLQVRSR